MTKLITLFVSALVTGIVALPHTASALAYETFAGHMCTLKYEGTTWACGLSNTNDGVHDLHNATYAYLDYQWNFMLPFPSAPNNSFDTRVFTCRKSDSGAMTCGKQVFNSVFTTPHLEVQLNKTAWTAAGGSTWDYFFVEIAGFTNNFDIEGIGVMF